MTLTVYGRATSSNVQAVMWGAAELGLEPDRLDFGGRHGRLDDPTFAALTPHRLIPVLTDGDGLAVWESQAILRYLAARYGDGGPFWPADPAARSQVDQWMEWGKSTWVAAFILPIFWPRVRTPAKDRDEAALSTALTRFDRLTAVLETRLSESLFVAGPELTLADITIGHILYRYFTIDVPRPERPALRAYYDGLAGRPGYNAHVMVDYSELKAEGA